MKAKNGGIIMEFKFEVPADKMDLFTSYIGDAKRILEGKEPKFTVSSPKEISEEEIEKKSNGISGMVRDFYYAVRDGDPKIIQELGERLSLQLEAVKAEESELLKQFRKE